MELAHPERGQDGGFEPTVGEQIRLGQFINALERANEDELRTIAKTLAQQVLVTYPAAIRYLAKEAAANLAGHAWSKESSERLLNALQSPSGEDR
jgi:hypothetical protein